MKKSLQGARVKGFASRDDHLRISGFDIISRRGGTRRPCLGLKRSRKGLRPGRFKEALGFSGAGWGEGWRWTGNFEAWVRVRGLKRSDWWCCRNWAGGSRLVIPKGTPDLVASGPSRAPRRRDWRDQKGSHTSRVPIPMISPLVALKITLSPFAEIAPSGHQPPGA